jgi:hypothetical protein
MSTALDPDRPPRGGEEPPFIGYRYLKRIGPDGEERYEEVPLRTEDLLYPQEGDWVATNEAHVADMIYLREVFKARTADRPSIRVLSDHRIDFQVEGVQPLGPDVTVLNGEALPWDPARATFPIVDMKARILYAIEIISSSTRPTDLDLKGDVYYRGGVPVYIIIYAPYGGGRTPQGILVYQAGPDGYELMPLAEGRYWMEVVNVWLTLEDGRVACYDENGRRIGGYGEVDRERQAQTARADAEQARADVAEQARAAQAARADEMARRIQELEAEMRRLRGEGT